MNKVLPKPKAVIFDWDNTLADTEPSVHKALNKVLERYNKPLRSLEEFSVAPATSPRYGFEHIFGKKHAQEAQAYFIEKLLEIPLDEITLIKGAAQSLELIKKHNIITGVVSNKQGALLRREATHLGVHHYFKDIVGAYDTHADKPSLEPVKKIINDTNITLGPDIWFVGDSIIDLECAKNGNFTPIFRGCPQSALQKGINNDQLIKVPDLNDFADLLQKTLQM